MESSAKSKVEIGLVKSGIIIEAMGSMHAGREFMRISKRIGERTDPWGTPTFTSNLSDNQSPMRTHPRLE